MSRFAFPGGKYRIRACIAGCLLAVTSGSNAIWVGDNSAPFVANAPLDFELTIGSFLYLQVGSTGNTVDIVEFDFTTGPTPDFGSGTVLPATSNGTIKVAVRGNKGAIILSSLNTGVPQGLTNGSGGFIDFAEIVSRSSNNQLPSPSFTNAGSNSVNVTANLFAGFVTDQQAKWEFGFRNTVIPLPGFYKGEITYTAAMP